MKTATPKKATKTITIWIPAYRPMMLGGDVHAPVCTQVEGTPIDLGKGFKGYSVVTPAGGVVIAEAKSGAIVGQSLEQVLRDIERADPIYMKKQVKEATAQFLKSNHLPSEQFWTFVKGASGQGKNSPCNKATA